MKENWILQTKRADFQDWAQKLHITPLLAKLIRNRDILTVEEAREYLYGTMDSLGDPYLLADMGKAADLISAAVKKGEKIAVSSDYDDDGIFSGRILYEGLLRIGGRPVIFSPNRMTEGYGMNRRIVDQAKDQGCTFLITCDNGIAAFEAVKYAKEQGFTVVVTDHHEVQYEETEEGKKYLYPEADAIIDPKRPDSQYPFREYCGAGVAFRLIQVLYERFGIPKEEEKSLYEYVAIATVADVVILKGENRTMVRAGMEELHHTTKVPLLALCKAQNLNPADITSYHIGFVIGPCFNAIGRLGDVSLAFEFLDMTDESEAFATAEFIKNLNDERKLMTEEGFTKCVEMIEAAPWREDHVYAILLEGVHESIVGIIAGRVKEKYNRPVFVFTRTEEGFIKGSGRSIQGYNMVAELIKVKDLLIRFGGHQMAAGLSLEEDKLELLRKTLNENQQLTEEDLTPRVIIDAEMRFSSMKMSIVDDFRLLEPFGMGNSRPLLAIRDAQMLSMAVRGKVRQIVSMLLEDDTRWKMNAVCFKDPEEFTHFLTENFGEERYRMFRERNIRSLPVSFAFYPSINDYHGEKSLQIVVENYCITKKNVI